MATFFLILVIILFVLAISDLIVGVSNDAVNFLNSAIGSRAASFRTVMLVAGAGVLVGATFSSGMMEVARKGIFHPEYFYFSEIIILFLAVMVTDVILLDAFNTFGMPTSTTVSIVFELLGAAVAISVIKIMNNPDALNLYEYINTGKAIEIITGIFLSVLVAFTVGAVIQYLSRLLFSFDYEKRMKSVGPIWGGLGIMAITYFILIKGAKGASWLSADLIRMVHEQTLLLMGISFAGWTIILYLLNRLFKVDILTVLVMVGTFALAMAFAGNDLVNFIGVPLAGYNSYQLFIEAGGTGADQLLMDGLAGKVPTPTLLLLLAGVIMVITLYTSKKARSVVQTSLDLGRQDEGSERFKSYYLSRAIVRNTTAFAGYIDKIMPQGMKSSLNRQFDETPFTTSQAALGAEAPVFDKIRASVTLVVASVLIAVGTNLKLPLSTTYVTFMVFMGTSLADGAWGRESAVYRVSGVLSVIGGWFFTAFSAFTAAFIIAMIFHYGGIVAIAIILCIAGFLMYRTHHYHKGKEAAKEALDLAMEDGDLTKEESVDLCKRHLNTFLMPFQSLVDDALDALGREDLGKLRSTYKEFGKLEDRLSTIRSNSNRALDRVQDNDLESGHLYILVIEYLEEMAKEVKNILLTTKQHVDNNHKPLQTNQIEELKSVSVLMGQRYDEILNVYATLSKEGAAQAENSANELVAACRAVRKEQIQRIRHHDVGTRNSVLFMNHLGSFRNIALFCSRIVNVLDELIINPDAATSMTITDVRDALEYRKGKS